MLRCVVRRAGVAALPLALVFVTAAGAQETVVVRGRVLGPDNTPVALERVMLHRVDRSGGATVAESTSGADGHFNLNAPASSDASAIYFVAARYQGELYIGEPFRPATQGIPEQLLQVGVAANSATAILGGAEDRPPPIASATDAGNVFLLVIPLLIAGASVLFLILPRRRVPPERAALIRIAEIDERLPAAPQGQRDALREERSRLFERLRAG